MQKKANSRGVVSDRDLKVIALLQLQASIGISHFGMINNLHYAPVLWNSFEIPSRPHCAIYGSIAVPISDTVSRFPADELRGVQFGYIPETT